MRANWEVDSELWKAKYTSRHNGHCVQEVAAWGSVGRGRKEVSCDRDCRICSDWRIAGRRGNSSNPSSVIGSCLWLVAAFLTALGLFLAHYHGRRRLGTCLAAITLCLPYIVTLMWIRLSGRSLLYSVAAVVLLGIISMWTMHRRLAGTSLEDDPEVAIIQKMMEDPKFNLTWTERLTWLGITSGAVLLLILLLR